VTSSTEIEVVDREVLQLQRSRPLHEELPQAEEGGGRKPKKEEALLANANEEVTAPVSAGLRLRV
jgi:hypothetical protein